MKQPIVTTLVIETISQSPETSSLLQKLQDQDEYVLLGDFSDSYPGRYSYLAFAPEETVTYSQNQPVDPFDILSNACQKYKLEQTERLPVPFVGGWIGYLAYDLNRYIEKLPDSVEHDIPMCLMHFGFYDTVLAWDHHKQKGYLLALEYNQQKHPLQERLTQLRHLMEETHCRPVTQQSYLASDNQLSVTEIAGAMENNITTDDYLDKVSQAIEFIKAGDIFEVNLSQRFSCPFSGSAGKLYHYLTGYNPAAYSALIKTTSGTIVSASPELFLSKRKNHICTRPIKGTIARRQNQQQDELNRQKLLASEKDIAELNMIIDLERNDLGRICSYGSVKIAQQRIIETHPSLYHAVATIAGTLRPDISVAEILRATFPGGSVTGAPKIRAMEIIDQLEPTARSVYTGSIGWIGVNGDLDMNIAIRTIIIANQKAHLQVGGAIVADSDPQCEYDETIAKAAALLHALHAE
jgi:para-aminobenzoate synthetase component 1